MNDSIKTNSGQNQTVANTPQGQKPAKAGMFKESDYGLFMAGVFVIGGLIGVPLTYGLGLGLGYFAALPWSLGSCVVFLIAFRRNGTISWGRAIPAMIALVVAGTVYNQSTGKPSFGAGGVFGFLLVMVCGYIGIGIARLVGIGKR